MLDPHLGFDPYDILQLNGALDPSAKAIKRAYRRLSLSVHPDKCADRRASSAFQRAVEARDAFLCGAPFGAD